MSTEIMIGKNPKAKSCNYIKRCKNDTSLRKGRKVTDWQVTGKRRRLAQKEKHQCQPLKEHGNNAAVLGKLFCIFINHLFFIIAYTIPVRSYRISLPTGIEPRLIDAHKTKKLHKNILWNFFVSAIWTDDSAGTFGETLLGRAGTLILC